MKYLLGPVVPVDRNSCTRVQRLNQSAKLSRSRVRGIYQDRDAAGGGTVHLDVLTLARPSHMLS
jgi:hypothetical protein